MELQNDWEYKRLETLQNNEENLVVKNSYTDCSMKQNEMKLFHHLTMVSPEADNGEYSYNGSIYLTKKILQHKVEHCYYNKRNESNGDHWRRHRENIGNINNKR